MIRISFVLPVYNVEAFIEICLESLFSQGLHESEFEVICVDDCSSDRSADIIREWQKEHSNLFLLMHSKNKKAGAARNTGLLAARGEYIWFVDPDDTIIPGAVTKLLEKCEVEDMDTLSFNMLISSGTQVREDITFVREEETQSGIVFLNRVFGDSIIYYMGYPVRTLYRRRLLLEHAILFPENMPFGEDTTFMVEAISCSNNTGCITDCLYCYRQHDTSVSAQLFKQMRGDLIYYSCLAAADLILSLVDTIAEKSDTLATNLRSGIPWFVNRLFMRLIKTSRQERSRFYSTYNMGTMSNSSLLLYMDARNRFILSHPVVGRITLELLAIVYKFKHFGGRIIDVLALNKHTNSDTVAT